MSLEYHIPFFTIFIPMITALIINIVRNNKATKYIAILSLLSVLVLDIIMVRFMSVNQVDTFTYMLGHFPAPWGNELKTGQLEVALNLAFSLVMILSVLGGSRSLLDDVAEDKHYIYYIMVCMTFASISVLTYTNDIFTSYVFIEINTIAACSIVVLKETGETVRATLKYFIMSSIGSGIYLFAISTLYGITGHLLMEPMHKSIVNLVSTEQYMFPLTASLILILAAIGIKSALFPFHNWLPDAHGSATSSSSAILSALVLKGYIVLFVKILYRVYGMEVIRQLNILPVILALGLMGMIFGSIFALFQTELKKMIAYSSVAQIGYIFTGIGLGTPAGLAAAMFHILTHAFTKSGLFLVSGSMIHETHNKKISKMNGIGALMPITMTVFIIGGLSMIGIPPSIGFSSKWYFSQAMLSSDFVWVVLLLLLSSLLNAAYYLPIVIKGFFSDEYVELKKQGKRLERPILELLPVMVLSFVVITVGLYSTPIYGLIAQSIKFL